MASKDVGTLRTRLSWEDEGSTKSLKGFRDDLKGLRAEMNNARSGGREYTNSLKGLGEQSDILTRRLKTQKEQVAEIKKRYDEAKRVKGEDSQVTKDLATQYNNASAQMNRTEEQLRKLNEEIRRQQSPWTQLGEKLKATGDKFQEVGRQMTDFGKSYSMRVTAPIVAGGVAVFKASSDYESAFAGVRKTVDATEEQFSTLSRGIRDMAKELPASANEIAGIAEVAGQLGIKTEDILKFTRTMTDLGVATNMSSEEAATSLARLANITQLPMDQIDRLGSTVVDLGNNLATTEKEIVDMGLRLAGAGKQVGMTEAEILSFSGALSSVGIEAEAGGSAFSKVMVNMQLATETGGKKLEDFARVAGMSASDFKKAFENDASGAIVTFIKGLADAESQGKTAIGMLDDMGISEVRMRDALLRAAGASDVFTDALEIGSSAWDENIALTKEAEERYKTTESQLKIMWNRVKDVAITLGDALVPAVMSAIDAAEPLIKQIESGAKAFSEMDKEQQQTILKMIALVAAVGPASIMLGGLTTSIGGVLKVGGSLATALGATGGTGLIGRIGLMGLGTNPVGLAVLGVGALALGIYAVAKASEESTVDVLKSIQTRREEIDSVDELISRFETLKDKNKLSTDEVLRYMDTMSELKNAKSEDTIKALTEEQARLLEKSGFTNDEMEEFLRLNGEIVKKSPSTVEAISEQGNAYAGVLDELKQLNKMEREQLTLETQMKLNDAIVEQASNLENVKNLTSEIGDKQKERKVHSENILSTSKELIEQDKKIIELQKELATATGKEFDKLVEKLSKEQTIKTELEGQLSHQQSQYDLIGKQIGKKEKSLEKSREELAAFKELTDEYAQMVLYEQGIVSEKGKAVEKLKEEQTQLDKNRTALEKQKDAGKLLGDAYDEQNRSLNEQQKKIDEAKNKLIEMNRIAGEKIYKDINVKTNPHVDTINKLLSKSVSKIVNIVNRDNNPTRLSYAKGTDFHPGGRFLAGEEGYELGKLGNRWEMLNFGHYDRPAGYQVFTHDESKSILNALNRMPAYAGGVSPTGEADRITNTLNNRGENQPQAIHIKPSPVILDGRVIGEVVFETVDVMHANNFNVEAYMRGG